VTKNQKTILLAVVAVIAVLVIALGAIGVWVAASLFDNQSMDESAAARDVSLEPDATGRRVSTSLYIDDIERYGPALLVGDALPDGGRVLVWSD
jgi:cell division protein YceG involved in septum cleavage